MNSRAPGFTRALGEWVLGPIFPVIEAQSLSMQAQEA